MSVTASQITGNETFVQQFAQANIRGTHYWLFVCVCVCVCVCACVGGWLGDATRESPVTGGFPSQSPLIWNVPSCYGIIMYYQTVIVDLLYVRIITPDLISL